jgi:predicted nuclease of predicted toxin-antitoxin system
VKFIVDAQFPRRMIRWFEAAGCDAIHTRSLPTGNRTPDDAINAVAEHEERIVVTKDADFVDTHLLSGRPPKLLLISTGNITNAGLESLMAPLVSQVLREFESNAFIELSRSGLIVRG